MVSNRLSSLTFQSSRLSGARPHVAMSSAEVTLCSLQRLTWPCAVSHDTSLMSLGLLHSHADDLCLPPPHHSEPPTLR
jgi:hypothetical protein